MALRPQLRGLSICAGIGGIDLGLTRAMGNVYRSVCYIEREAFPAAVLAARMEEGRLHPAPIWSDVKTFDPRPWIGAVDIVTAGYPCQPFSAAGKRKGTEDPRHIWPYIAQIIAVIRPTFAFFENVPGHISLGLDVVHKDLCDMGYSVEAGVFSAAEVGAPHVRKRLFILCHAAHSIGQRQWRGPPRRKAYKRENTPDIVSHGSQKSVAYRNDAERRPDGAAGCTLVGHVRSLSTRRQQGANDARISGQDVADSNNQRCGKRWSQAATRKRRQRLVGNRHQVDVAVAEKNHAIADVDSQADGLPVRLGDDWSDEWEDGVARTVGPGFENRIPMLQALGNAVVPACAAKAFVTLLQRFQ